MKKNRASLLLILFIQLICLSAQAEDYYWIGGSGDWNDIEHWSDQPGGNVNSNALVPGKDDDVYFDEYSFPDAGAEVTITSVARCMNMYWGNVTNMPTLNTDDNEAHYLAIYGGVTFNNLMVLDLDRSLYFRASTSGNVIDFGGKTFDGDIYFENNGGWRITSEINLVNNTIYFNQGSLSIEADITCGAFLSEASVSRVLYLNSSTLTLDKSGSSVLSIQSDNLTLDAGDSKIEVISSNSSFATSGDDALEFYDLVFSGDNGSLESDAIFTSFNDITFEMDGSMQGDNEMQNLIFTSGHTYAISGDGTQTVNAKFEALGECYDFIIIEGDVYGGTISAAEVDLDYLKVENINASGAAIPFVANNSYNLGGNNTNWTFIEPSSADYTWIGAGGDNKWGTKENWNAGCVPSRNNNVIIGASYTVEIDVSAECKGLDIDDSSTLEGSEDLDIYGSLAADSCTWNFSGETQFSGDNTNTISFNGSFLGLVTFYGNGSWTLNSNLSVLDILDLEEGTLTANSYTISAEQFSSTSNYIRALDISNSVFEITTGVSKAWNIQGSGLTLTSNNSEIQLLSSGAELYHNTTDGLTYGTVSFTAADGQALLTNEGMATQPHFESLEFVGNAKLTGDHQFDQLIFSQGKEYFFNAGSIQKILVADGLIAHGTCSEYITFTGDGGTAYFDCDVNSTDLYRLRIEDVNVTGGIGSLTANESIGISGYDGWIFLDDLTGSKIYWTGNVDNDWFTAGNWEGGCLPTRKDTVVFNNDKVLLTYEVNISSTSDDAECASMIWTNADLMSFSGDQPISIFADLDFSGMINANFAYSGDFYFKAVDTTAATIDAGAVSLLGDLTFMGTLQEDDTWSAGSWTLQSELNTEGTIKLEYGDLISNDQNMEASSFVSNFDVDQPRSLSLGSSTFTLESFKVTPESFTFDAGTSEIIFDTAGELIVTKGSDPLDFYNVSVTEADGNAYIDIYSDDITFNNLVLSGNTYFRMTNDSEISFTANSIEMAIGKTYEFQSGQTFVFTDIIANGACEGSIDITGSDSDPAIFQANTGVTEITVSSVNLLNISAEPDGIFVANESIDLGGNDGWTFENEPDGDDLYWIGGTGYWDDPNHWATTSGAAVADGCVPTVKDNVFFDDGSFDDTEQTVYTGASDIRCRSMNWTGSEGNRPNFEMGDTDITGVYIYGSLILNSTMEIDLSAMVDFYFRATEAQVIESFGYVFPNIVEFDGSGGEWTLQDSLVVEGDVYIRNGKLISDGNDIECKSLTSNDETVGESTRGLDIQNSNLTINGTEDELGFSLNIKLTDPYYDQGFDLLAEGSNITFSDAASVYLAGIKNQTIEFDTITFLQDGSISTFNNLATFFPYVGYLSFNQNGVVSGHYQFGTVELGRGYDFEFKAGNIYEMDYFLAEGSCFAPISIHSSEDGTQTTISSANDVNGEFLELQDIAG
ncbi:hypothetical protein, partial [Labilibaculum sp.]|uniref:hypothetical protein n=1 Tax=Labilibaculum sp. TaxID=2060723 RepID=UPI0035672AAB